MARKMRRQRGVPVRVRKRPGERVYTARGGKAHLTTRVYDTEWVADQAMVDFPLRRKGLITRLYEVAAEDACHHGARLVSSIERSPFSEAFWRKQKRKGRARCLAPNKTSRNVWRGPVLDLEYHLAQKYRDPVYGEPDYERAAKEMKKLKLPKSRWNQEIGGHWRCLRWGFKRKMCKEPQPFDLSGLPSWRS